MELAQTVRQIRSGHSNKILQATASIANKTSKWLGMAATLADYSDTDMQTSNDLDMNRPTLIRAKRGKLAKLQLIHSISLHFHGPVMAISCWDHHPVRIP